MTPENRNVRTIATLAVTGLALTLAIGGAAAASPPQYTITDLGPIDGASGELKSDASGINNRGEVAGRTLYADLNTQEPTVWLPLGAWGLPAGAQGLGGEGRAYDLNDLGQAVGFVNEVAFLWDPGEGILPLGTLGGPKSNAQAVNNDGWVVGYSETVDPETLWRAFLYRDGEMTDLGNFGGLWSRAYDINESGQIAGQLSYPTPDGTDSILRAFLWLPEPAYGLPAGLNDIDDYSVEITQWSTAEGINDRGEIAAWINPLDSFGNSVLQFGLWLPEPAYGLPAGWTDLGGPWGMRSTAYAQDINNRGEAVFRANIDPDALFGDWRAMVWRQGEWFDLIECIPAADQAEWWFGSATDINESGQIAGWGSRNGALRGFLLTPFVSPFFACPGDLDADGGVDVDDLVAVFTNWGACGGPPCGADVDGDGIIGSGDLAEVIAGWGGCPEDPAGACCFPVTGECLDLSASECQGMGGSFSIGGCDSDPCAPPPTGACCLYPSGACLDATELVCVYVHDGTWQGPGTLCETTDCPLPVPGDRIEDPFLVTSVPFNAIGATSGFVNDYDESCTWSSDAPDVVYAWTPERDRAVRISLCGDTDYDSKLFVYENDAGSAIACNDDYCTTPSYPDNPYVSRIDVLEATAGNTYYIVIDGFGGWMGNYTLAIDDVDVAACCTPDGGCTLLTEDMCGENGGLWQGAGTDCTIDCPIFPIGACCVSNACIDGLTHWDCETVFGGTWQGSGTSCADVDCLPVPGDRIEDPLPIATLPFAATGDTGDYLDWHDEACDVAADAPEVVYAYTPLVNELVTISLCGNSAYDTKLYVYEDGETPGAPYACDDDTCMTPSFPLAPFVSEIAGLQLFAGHTYSIVVDGFGSYSGVYTLDITYDPPPPGSGGVDP